MKAPPAKAATGHLDERLAAIASRHPAVGLAVGVVRDGRLAFFYGHGLADIASGTPVTEDTVFRIGSITKTFTAIAVMQLCEQGLVDLDAPAGDQLRAYRLIPAKRQHRPPTVRQLLTHTAGLPQLLYPTQAFQPVLGETVPYGQGVPALAEFYRGGLHLIAEPGTRHTYSNHGFATLGQIIEDVTGQPLSRYFREHVFGPLGMTGTDLARPDRISARLATGYALRAGGPHPVRDRDLVTPGAGGIYSTTADMARYVAALLAGGSGEHGQILKPETLTSMFAPHYQPDPRLPGVGLAFFRRNLGGHLAADPEYVGVAGVVRVQRQSAGQRRQRGYGPERELAAPDEDLRPIDEPLLRVAQGAAEGVPAADVGPDLPVVRDIGPDHRVREFSPLLSIEPSSPTRWRATSMRSTPSCISAVFSGYLIRY